MPNGTVGVGLGDLFCEVEKLIVCRLQCIKSFYIRTVLYVRSGSQPLERSPRLALELDETLPVLAMSFD